MKVSTLHSHIRYSVRRVVSSHYEGGFRFVLESGSAEGFLRDLLAIELKERGYSPIREGRTKSGNVDIVLKEAPPEYIEAKQLHLKDGGQFVKNVSRDTRHAGCRCLGIIYLADQRGSRFKMKRRPFDDANRNTNYGIPELMTALRRNFQHVYPNTEKQALIRQFRGAGRLDLYAFVVEKVRFIVKKKLPHSPYSAATEY